MTPATYSHGLRERAMADFATYTVLLLTILGLWLAD